MKINDVSFKERQLAITVTKIDLTRKSKKVPSCGQSKGRISPIIQSKTINNSMDTMKAHNMQRRKKPISSGFQVLNSTMSKYSTAERNLQKVKRRTRRAFVREQNENCIQGFVEKHNSVIYRRPKKRAR